MKVAIVHDDFIQHGGAERLVLAMLEIWPQADLYSVMASEAWRKEIKKYINKEIKTTWVSNLPHKEKLFRYYYALYPLAIESFNFDSYDLVISSSSRYAHGIITKPGTVHVAYVNSPARFLWEESLVPSSFLLKPFVSWHRVWDQAAAQRPDFIIANSQTPAKRIQDYWGRRADAIIYPFVNLPRFCPGTSLDYFLVVSRLKKWKRVDVAIEACNQLKLPLVVVGEGDDRARLRKLSGSTVKFLEKVNDEQLAELYASCRALIMTQEEDFGITSLEAQACGKPVIAYGEGGARETVVDGITGVYFNRPTKESLINVLAQFDETKFIGENCRKQAEKFGKERFKTDLQNFVTDALRKY